MDAVRWSTTCVYYGLALLQVALCVMVDRLPQGGSEAIHQFEVSLIQIHKLLIN